MSREKMIAVHNRLDQEVISNGKLDLIDEIVTADFVWHSPPGPDLCGPEALKQYMAAARAAFPDTNSTVEDRFVEGDRLVVRVVLRGTHRGEFMGIPATGRQVSFAGISIHRFAGDRIQESWNCLDNLGLLQQLGGIPSPT